MVETLKPCAGAVIAQYMMAPTAIAKTLNTMPEPYPYPLYITHAQEAVKWREGRWSWVYCVRIR